MYIRSRHSKVKTGATMYAKARKISQHVQSLCGDRPSAVRPRECTAWGGNGAPDTRDVKPPRSFPSHTRLVASPISSFLESLTKQTASSAFPVLTTRDSTEAPSNPKRASAAHAAQVFIRPPRSLNPFPRRVHFVVTPSQQAQ
jgi:hypothetical protein